jgi:signal transduction histidine kinase
MAPLFRNNRTLLSGVLWRVLPLSIATLIAIWMVVIQVSEQSLQEETYTRILEKVEGLALATDTRVSNILTAVRNLAATNLIVNSLIYDELNSELGDQSYMGAFFRSLKVAGLRAVSLKVLDYKGRLMVGGGEDRYQQVAWVDEVMRGGEYLAIEPQRRQFRFATPIEYNGKPEGVLLLEVERKVLLEYLGAHLPMGAVLLRHDHAVLYSALWGVDDELTYFDPPKEVSGMIEYEQSLRLFPGIILRYGEDHLEAFASLQKLHRALLLVLLLDLFALVVGIVVAGRAVVRPIAHMTAQLEQQQQAPGQEVQLALEGVVEVDQLVSSYNRLQQITRELNQRLKKQFETMEQVFSSMADALVVLDREGCVVELNPAAAALLGVEIDALDGQPVAPYIEQQREREVVIHAAGGEDIPALRAESHSSDSSYTIWVLHDLRERLKAEQQEQYGAFQAGIAEMGASVLHNIGNAITGMTGNVANIGKQNRIIARLARLLLDQGQQSGLPLSDEQQLRLQQVVGQSGQVLEKIAGADGVEGYIAKLNHAIQHVGEVISIQQSAARPVVHATHFQINMLVSDTLGLIQDSLDKRKIRFEREVEAQIPRLFLPRNPMIQLLLNLIKNSMEAIVEQMRHDSTLQGRITLHARQLNGKWLELVLEDNGCGLESSKLAVVFQSHFSTKERGSGYGLHSAGNFVSSLGGEIELRSDGLGEGAAMWIRLPLVVERES